MELLRCRRESVENVRKSANVTSMVSCRIFPSRPRKTPWKIPHGNLSRFTGHHCEFQSYRTLYQTTRGGFWSVVFFLIFENHHIFEPGSWEPSKHMYQGGRSEFLLVELWPSVSVHETHSISIVHRILQVCRDNLQGFLTCWGIQLMTVSFDPRCSSVRALLVPWHRHRHSQESNLGFRIETANVRQQAEKLISPFGFQLSEVVWSCLNFAFTPACIQQISGIRICMDKKREKWSLHTSPSRHQLKQPQGFCTHFTAQCSSSGRDAKTSDRINEAKGGYGRHGAWENIEMGWIEMKKLPVHWVSFFKFNPKVHLTNAVKTFTKEQQLETPSKTCHFGSYQEISKSIQTYQEMLIERLPGPPVPVPTKFCFPRFPCASPGIIDPCKDHGIGSRLW